MDLTLLLAADYANTTADNKLNIMGVFSTINAVNFPSVHPEMFLITQLSGGPAEYGRTFRLSIKLIDEDASQEIVVFSNEVVFQRGSGGNKVHLNHLLRLVNLVFPKPGTYQFSVLADQDEKGMLMIEVNQIPAPTR